MSGGIRVGIGSSTSAAKIGGVDLVSRLKTDVSCGTTTGRGP